MLQINYVAAVQEEIHTSMNQPLRRSLAGPIILIAVGVLFLIHNLTGFNFVRVIWRYWPLIVIALGITKLIEYFRYHGQATK